MNGSFHADGGPVFPNSAIVRAPERLLLKGGAWRMLDIKVRYGLWQHERFGAILIDSGYGRHVTQGAGRSLPLKIYAGLFTPRLVEPDSIATQLAVRGQTHADVGAVVVTHFHPDHIAGLRDFPAAKFFASGSTYDTLLRLSARQRIMQGVFLELLPDDFASRLVRIEELPEATLPHGLGLGRDIFGDGSCVAVRLPGHALGHFGVLWPRLAQPLLYAVDAQWLWQAIAQDRPPAGLARLIFADWPATLASAELVRRFSTTGGEVVLCHEPGNYARDASP